MIRAAFWLSAIAIGLVGAPRVAYAGVTFTLSFDFVEVEASPRTETHRLAAVHHYTINKNNVLLLKDRNNAIHEIRLGKSDSFSPRGYEDGTVTARVRNRGLLLRFRYPGRLVTVSITPDGANACTASFVYSKTPGHKYFELYRNSNGEKMFDADEHVENLRCSAAENSD